MKAFLCATLAIAAMSGFAATPTELDAMLKSGQKVTVIDLRSTGEYQSGHIIGAINIPHHIIGEKRLPPLGKVVAYSDGLTSAYLAESMTALNAKPGIQAESLEGGYAAWQTFTNVTAEAVSIHKATARTITYEELQATKGQNVIILDVRKDPAAVAKARGEPVKDKVNLATFRQTNLPAAAITADAFGQLKRLKGNKKSFDRAQSLLVVVDNDNASAMATAERIRQAGYERVVVLAGGEEIIRRQGKSGLSRQGAAAPITLDPALKPQPLGPKK